jgi:hypothetical protein
MYSTLTMTAAWRFSAKAYHLVLTDNVEGTEEGVRNVASVQDGRLSSDGRRSTCNDMIMLYAAAIIILNFSLQTVMNSCDFFNIGTAQKKCGNPTHSTSSAVTPFFLHSS